MKEKIYLDNAATTPIDEEVVKAIIPYFNEKYGNASSLHDLGREAREAIENSRRIIAEFINAEPDEIIFTSGGTESDNLAIKGLAAAYPGKKHIITSKIEHPAVLETCRALEKQGFKMDLIGVNREGIVNIHELMKKISTDTLLVSIMHINNEIGTIQPIDEIARICKKNNVLFHTDAVQSFGKLKIDVKKQNIDLMSASGHKINGPKGIGFLYVKNGTKINPVQNGGRHEKGLRAGTENVPGIIGLGKATEICEKKMKNFQKVKKLRDKLINGVLEIKEVKLNGSWKKRIYTNANFSFKNVEGESLLMMLNNYGIFASTGSACSSHSLKPSHVLKAIGINDEDSHGSLRLTLGFNTNDKQISYAIQKIKESVEKLREIAG